MNIHPKSPDGGNQKIPFKLEPRIDIPNKAVHLIPNTSSSFLVCGFLVLPRSVALRQSSLAASFGRKSSLSATPPNDCLTLPKKTAEAANTTRNPQSAMASATGIPQESPSGPDAGNGEMEPLLGRPGDASQKPNASIAKNLILGMFILVLSSFPLPSESDTECTVLSCFNTASYPFP